MRKRSILIFCPVLGAFGGTETHIVGIASALSRHGWAVRVAVLSSALNAKAVGEIRDSGAIFAVWPSPSFFRSFLSPCDVLYTNSQGNASSLLWRLKGYRHCGFHHIHTSADVDEQFYWPSGFRSFVQRAKRLVACSQVTRRNLVEAGARGEISFLPYLTSVSIAGLEPIEGRPIHCPKRFAFIGRVEKPKGIDLIMEAARSPDCAGIEWHIHGEGEYLDVLRLAKLPTVVLHGAFSGTAALDKIHSEADALILPSFHSEGMPLALLEGMAKGLPWIATNKGGIAELAGGHEDLMVFEPGDVGSFIRSSARMRDRLDSCLVDRIAIQRFFLGSFAKETVTRQWMEYCDQLLGGEP